MEMDLKNIIDRIKEEGVGEAERKAADIISQAEDKAKDTLSGAEAEKEEVLKKAAEKAGKLKKNSEEALRQAARDVLLGLRGQITDLFDRVMKEKVAGQLTPDVLKEMIIRLVDHFKEDEKADIEILFSEKDKKALEKELLADLEKEMAKGVLIKASSGVEKGFRIGKKDENSYYDFTDEAIMETFKAFLNPKITELLDPGSKKDE